jgi:hypothetical protein
MASDSHSACTPSRRRRLVVPGAREPGDLRGRPVGEEVEDREGARQERRRDREGRELRRPEVADDGGVHEHVEGLGGQRPEGGHGQTEDLAVVDRAQHARDRTIRLT